MKEGESVQHVKVMTEVFETLSVIGDPITEEDRVVYLLASLPQAYDMIVTALESSPNVPVMETVIERLYHEERKMKEREGGGGDFGKVFAAYRAKRVFKCHYCGKPGHLKRDCRIRLADERREKASDSGPREKANQVLRSMGGEEKDVLLASQALSVRMTSSWIIDSGASSHMCNDEQLFTKMETLKKPLEIVVGDGHVVKSHQQGTVSLMMKLPGNECRKCNLCHVLYVPNLSYNLVSVSKAVKAGKVVEFDGKQGQIKSVEGKLTAIGTRIGNLYYMDCYNCRKNSSNISTQHNSQDIWHRRFGHLGIQNLRKLANEKMVDGLDCNVTTDTDLCEPCIGGKHHKSPFPKSCSSHSKNPLNLVHSDVCGKMGEKSMGGAEYFLTFVDDKSHYVWVYPLKKKSDVFEKFKLWKKMAEKSSGCVLKTLRTDNGGEFISAHFGRYLCSEGIQHELTLPKTPQQNGVTERLNRTLLEKVRSMLIDQKVPHAFWAEALATSVYLKNRSPTSFWIGRHHLKLGKEKSLMLATCEFLVVMLMFMCPKMNKGNLIQQRRNSCYLVMVKKPKDIDYMILNKTRSFLAEMYIFMKTGKTIYWNHLRSNIQKLKRLFFKMT